jgi:hypothetical protein
MKDVIVYASGLPRIVAQEPLRFIGCDVDLYHRGAELARDGAQ